MSAPGDGPDAESPAGDDARVEANAPDDGDRVAIDPSVRTPLVDPAEARRRANEAILVTAGVYLAYGVSGLLPIPGDIRYLLLIAAFYFLPAWVLRRDPERQRRWQVGPGGVIPPVTRRGLRWAGIAALVVFPPFVLGFLWFYAHVCHGQLQVLAPVTWLEGLTPWAGGLERYLAGLCRRYGDAMFPTAWAVPSEWLAWGGLGTVLAIAIELLAIAMPEEVFHRGYLMSALEEHWVPRRRILGVPLGIGAVLASALFALGHLVGMAEVARLATFFPALVFSWLFRRSGSLWAPALFHTASNLLMAVLLASTFPR